MRKEIEIDVRDLLGYLRKRWAIVALIVMIAMVCGFGVTKFFITPVYESQSMIYITSGGGNGSVVQNMLSTLQAGNALTADYKTLATSKPVLEQVIEDLELDTDYETLKNKVSTENPENTRILSLMVKDTDPRQAKKIVDKLTEIERDRIADVMNTTKPNVMQWGDIQDDPVSASPVKVGITSGLIMLLLCLGWLFISFIQNDNIFTPEDIEKVLDMKNLAEIPAMANEDEKKKGIIRRRK